MHGNYHVKPVNAITGLRHAAVWPSGHRVTEQTFASAHATREYMAREYPEAREQAGPFATQPTLPYASGSETSRAAAESMADSAGSIRNRIHAWLLTHPEGATRQQIYKAFKSSMQTIGPRVLELMAAGLAYEDGTKRPTDSGRAAFVVFAREAGDTRPIPCKPETKTERLTRLGNELARCCTAYIGLPESTEAVAAWNAAVRDAAK